jgi:phospho-N-acetylmuramoyl-pentapeptide-transferase
MLYYLFTYLDKHFDISGAGLFQYITFRSSMAILISLVISMIIGGKIIALLKRLQVGETIRELGLQGENSKKGTPTMGGIIILSAILIPVLLFARLENVYIILLLVATVWMGFIGFLDDYIKVFKKDKQGLRGRFKIIAQVGLGVFVGVILYFNDSVKIRDFDNVYVYEINEGEISSNWVYSYPSKGERIQGNGMEIDGKYYSHETRSLKTNIPFLKNNTLDYKNLVGFLGEGLSWIIFIPIVIFIITAVSNAANLTDGIDGLATGVSAIIIITLGIFAYVSGNINFAEYLNVFYIPDSGEILIFAAAFAGACIGFLWYNAYPAQVFMGDTGSLAIGGVIATMAIIIRKELLIPILCGIFLMENLSVMMQVSYFKYTRKKYGEGRRIFKMTPLHHHYQKKGMPEPKIVVRFWIVQILLAVLAIVTLKVR